VILTRSEYFHRIDFEICASVKLILEDSFEVAQTLKIALIGTHGVGKTTLAYEICSLLKKADHNVELVTEVARRSPFAINEGTTIQGKLWILHAQIAMELEAASRAEHLICDRSVLDNYCYLVNKFGRQPKLEQWLGWWMESYSLLVSVPPMADGIPPDGFRSENLEFQGRIHDLIGEMVSEPQFATHSDRVLWLHRRDRRMWGEMIFAATGPLLRSALRVHAAAAR
jgi:energy-coupling factor transporter ATP-binding protein EcfA2